MKNAILTLLLVSMILFSGCGQNSTVIDSQNSTSNQQQTVNDPAASNSGLSNDTTTGGEVMADTSELFSSRDFEVGYDESESAFIQLNGDTAASGSNAV